MEKSLKVGQSSLSPGSNTPPYLGCVGVDDDNVSCESALLLQDWRCENVVHQGPQGQGSGARTSWPGEGLNVCITTCLGLERLITACYMAEFKTVLSRFNDL